MPLHILVYLFVNELQIVHYNCAFNKMCKNITQYYNFMFVLKQLRRKKNVNQSDLAKAIGLSLRTIQLYEKKDANIPRKNLTKIAQYFEVSIAQLYAQEVNEHDIIYEASTKDSKKGHEIRKIDAGKYLVTVPLVTIKNQNQYLQEYDNQEFIHALIKIGFVVERVSVKTYIAFEISNNAMNNGKVNSMPQKTVVLGKQFSVKEFKNKSSDRADLYCIIVHKEGIMCKEILSYDTKKGTIICHSLNTSPEYPDFEIALDDVKQVFEIIKKQVD